MEKRFRSLRIIASVFKILAWIALIGGIVLGLAVIVLGFTGGVGAGLPRGPQAGFGILGGLFRGFLGGVLAVISSVLYFLILYATGDAIHLALAIEENTRETAYYLKGGDSYARRA